MQKRILIVDDEPAIRDMVAFALRKGDYDPVHAGDAREASAAIADRVPDLILLDWMLPGSSGLELARRWRRDDLTRDVPIIMLTARGEENDRVSGLESGVDDYVVKPFSARELLARIKAVLRRYGGADAESASRRESEIRSYRFAGWELATGTRRLTSPDGKRVELTNGEFALLVTFLKSPRRVLSRDQLLEGSRLHDDIYDRSIDVQILRLRRKIEADPANPRFITTERGAGYLFACAVEIVR